MNERDGINYLLRKQALCEQRLELARDLVRMTAGRARDDHGEAVRFELATRLVELFKTDLEVAEGTLALARKNQKRRRET